MHDKKIQSAMEYLMTYGWAILIIAVVLGALFGLGFFNSANLAPKVAAGSCQVYRPQGPGTTSFINLEGTCNNELPQYVAQFNGASSYISTGTTGLPLGSSARSEFAWVDTAQNTTFAGIYGYGQNSASEGLSTLTIRSAGGSSNDNVSMTSYTNNPISKFAMPLNTWVFVGFTYSAGSSSVTFYFDGQSQVFNSAFGGSALNTVLFSTNPSLIGARGGGSTGNNWNGLISNIQVYNTSLSANEVTALYQEGIGGVPVLPQDLVGWWPLNGNANDYSGNLNNGVPTSVVFTSSWTSGYTAP